MPYSTESPEWRLLQQVAEPLASRKTAFQPSPREWQSTPIDSDHYLERGLREIFLIRSHKFHLEDADFKLFRNKLNHLCRILEDAVNPVVSRTTGRNRTYPRLSGLVIFLKDLNEDNDRTFDLASSISEPLFTFSDEVKKRCSNVAKDINKLISDYSIKPCETETKDTGGLKRHQWRNSKIRARASDIFQMIFERFTCPERHKLLMEFAIACSGNEKPLDMEISISKCPTGCDESGWQSVFCSSKSEPFYKQEVYDLCADMNMFSGHDRDLHLLPRNGELLSAWSSRSIARPALEDTAKQSLSERIASGMFKPLTASYFIAQQLNSQRLVRRYTPKRKRILAVELGYWLLDFFDASLDSNEIYFFESFNELAKRDRFYCSFSTQFPSSPDFRIFQIGHPVLLTLAKILLELDDGEMIPIKISPHYGEENIQAWFQLMSALQLKGPGLDESYTKAVRGCLNVHTHLQDVDTESNKADIMIRDHLYHHIVQHLEISLEVRLTPVDAMRTPPIPTVAHDSKLMRNSTTSSHSTENTDIGLFKQIQHATEPTTSPTQGAFGAHNQESFNAKGGTDIQSRRVESKKGHPRRPTQQAGSFTDRCTNRRSNAPKNRRDFEVAIICALPLEFDAIQLLFDRTWEERRYQFGKLEGDSNFYVNGRLGNLDIVVLLLSKIGKASAANAATNLQLSYPGLKLVLLSGVCGGIPRSLVPNREENEVLLGDVFVSSTMIEYDFGRRHHSGFETKQANLNPTKAVENILIHFQTESFPKDLSERSIKILERIQKNRPKYRYPGAAKDQLFPSNYRHGYGLGASCICCKSPDTDCECYRSLSCDLAGCDKQYTVKRERLERKICLEKQGLVREAQKHCIFMGMFGSGDTVLKSSKDRDMLVEQFDVSAFEMEGAGLWEAVPCIVVKGVCDYADSHKSKTWQTFAAATSAAVVKALLEKYIKAD